MDNRTKILAALFGTMIVYALVSGVVYPKWIKKWVTIDDRVAERQEELDALQAEVARVEEARYEYRDWAKRMGSFDIEKTVTDVRDRLNKLLAKHKLADVKVTPTRSSEDRKTHLWTATVTVAGSGSLEAAINFLRDVGELPHLCRVGNAAITPTGSRGRKTTINRFNLRVPVEVWVLPQQKLVGRLKDKDLDRPEFFIRHNGRDYSRIWKGDPFNEYVPMRVATQPTLKILKGKKVPLGVTVSRGIPPYAYDWSPSAGLTNPKTSKPLPDSSRVGSYVYTVRVTDARGNTGDSVISVEVQEPPKKKEPPRVADNRPPPPPPPPTGPTRWLDARQMKLTMALLSESHGKRHDEVLVEHSRTKEANFYGVGDDFDGGTLVYVHQTGGVMSWEDQYYVYPLGESLDRFVSADDASAFPVLQRAARRLREWNEQHPSKKRAGKKNAKERDFGAKRVAGSTTHDLPTVVTNPAIGDTGQQRAAPLRPDRNVPASNTVTQRPGPAARKPSAKKKKKPTARKPKYVGKPR